MKRTEPKSFETSTRYADALQRIEARDYTIGIMGLGYVGLPLALTGLNAGFKVIGFDIDASRVALLNRGESGMKHISGDGLAEAVADGRFAATSDLCGLDEPDAILIAVPTPITRNREPNLSFVENSTRAIAAALRPGQLIVLEFDDLARHDPRGHAADT